MLKQVQEVLEVLEVLTQINISRKCQTKEIPKFVKHQLKQGEVMRNRD